ncbi:MAG: hypothetical protein GX589_05870, partial [Deltaproteobacteria bacterium]|nr:hypothetical protein [Deltaproteobacteria bacterium]
MQVDDRTLALELLAKAYPQASLEGIQHLAGDASGRRFLRLYLHGAPSPTIILMLLKRRLGPPAAGRPEITQDDSFV